MKITTMFMVYLIITLVLVTFQNIGTVDPSSGNIDFLNRSVQDSVNSTSGTSVSGVAGTWSTKIWWDSLLNPSDWSAGIFLLLIAAIVGVVIVGFTLSSLVSNSYPSDTFIFASVFVVSVGFGFYSSYLLSNFIEGEFSPIMCGSATFCMLPRMIGIVIGAMLFIPWVFACLKNWRTGGE